MNWLKKLFNKKETTSDNSEVVEIIPIMLEKYQIPFHLIIKFNGEVSYKCDIPDNLNKEDINREIEENIKLIMEED